MQILYAALASEGRVLRSSRLVPTAVVQYAARVAAVQYAASFMGLDAVQ